jgi:Protein of unknown function (DUF3307)
MQGSVVFWYLVIAHILADFPFQTDAMVSSKKYLSKSMVGHIAAVTVLAGLFTWHIGLGLCVGITHYLIDAIKIAISKTAWSAKQPVYLFVADQLVHIATLWALSLWFNPSLPMLLPLLPVNILNYQMMGVAVLFCIYPSSYIVKLSIQQLLPVTEETTIESPLQRAGRMIGQVERLLVFTLVCIGEYQAIGFLITGKSIIRFADKNSKAQSEYVIVGTLLSYLLALLAGLWVRKMMF